VKKPTTRPNQQAEIWDDPLVGEIRPVVREAIERILDEELKRAPGAAWYTRAEQRAGYRNGSLTRSLGTPTWRRWRMRYLTLGIIVCMVIGGAATAADAPLMAPIQKFIDSFNKGDVAAASATHAAVADLAIMDEVPPYFWRGQQAFQAWSTDLDGDSKKHGITDQVVTIGSPTREETNGDRAYVVVPAVYTFKEPGVAMSEAASQMTFALKKGADGWLIHGWTWTGPKPQPVAAPAKP